MNTIKATKRDPETNVKQLRRSGMIPCVIFGKELTLSIPAQIDKASAEKLIRTMREGSKTNVEMDGGVYHTLIKKIERDPVGGDALHISFQVLNSDEKYNSVADIILLNTDKVPGVLEVLQRQVAHRACPEHLIDTVTVDLDGRQSGTVIAIKDIPEFQSPDIELLDGAGNIVLRIKDKKRADPRST